MKQFYIFLIINLFIATSAANPAFMTPRDLLNADTSSNLNLRNNRNTSVTVYGLYVRQYAYVTPGESCRNATIIYPSSNITAGAVVMPVLIKSGGQAAIGSNYLYNMIFGAIYYENIIIPSSPPGCALPGCTWGTDSTIYHWCIYIGALAPVTTSTGYTANVPPATDAASSVGVYNYDLIENYTYLGPLSCDDQTLSCRAASQQTQTFS